MLLRSAAFVASIASLVPLLREPSASEELSAMSRHRRRKGAVSVEASEYVLYYEAPRPEAVDEDSPRPPVVIRREDLPDRAPGAVRILLVSDTHGREDSLGVLPSADVFIHAGDILSGSKATDGGGNLKALKSFNEWLGAVDAPQKFVIGGNHDNFLEQAGMERVRKLLSNCTYLEFSGARCRLPELDLGRDLVVYGVPYSEGTSWNDGFRHSCPPEELLRASCRNIAEEVADGDDGNGVDILITHGPSPHIARELRPSLLHVHGHIHKGHGIYLPGDIGVPVWGGEPSRVECLTVCASVLDNSYRPRFEPILIDVPVGIAV